MTNKHKLEAWTQVLGPKKLHYVMDRSRGTAKKLAGPFSTKEKAKKAAKDLESRSSNVPIAA